MTVTSNRTEVADLLLSEDFDRSTRLLRLQGWRGAELATAARAGNAHRLAPATCSVLGFATAATSSVPLALATAASAAIGVIAANHPVEMVFNSFARNPIPPNRAAKRLGCAAGLLLFAAAALALSTGQSAVGTALALTMGVLAGFVATTNVCVPSLMFTLLFGADRATCSTLQRAWSNHADRSSDLGDVTQV